MDDGMTVPARWCPRCGREADETFLLRRYGEPNPVGEVHHWTCRHAPRPTAPAGRAVDDMSGNREQLEAYLAARKRRRWWRRSPRRSASAGEPGGGCGDLVEDVIGGFFSAIAGIFDWR